MANDKMENLKAMKTDNLLGLEDMDEIAGGNYSQMANDTRFLNVLLRGRSDQPDRYGEWKCGGVNFRDAIIAEMQQAWKSVGISFTAVPKRDNIYKLGEKTLTQAEAWAHAEKVVGRHLQESDWNW